jgi:hypothetical protein
VAAAPERARAREERKRTARFARVVGTAEAGMATFMIRADIATIDLIDGTVATARIAWPSGCRTTRIRRRPPQRVRCR